MNILSAHMDISLFLYGMDDIFIFLAAKMKLNRTYWLHFIWIWTACILFCQYIQHLLNRRFYRLTRLWWKYHVVYCVYTFCTSVLYKIRNKGYASLFTFDQFVWSLSLSCNFGLCNLVYNMRKYYIITRILFCI